jgi:hypothetical protein
MADIDQAPALRRDLADAEHAGGVREVAALDCGHVHIDDVTILEHVILVREAVAYDIVDGGADAIGIALEIEVGRHGAMCRKIGLDPLVDVHRRDAGTDMLSHIVEHAHVHSSRGLDALDVSRHLQKRARQHLFAVIVETLHLHVGCFMAFLVFLPASAPAGIVPARHRLMIEHRASSFSHAISSAPPYSKWKRRKARPGPSPEAPLQKPQYPKDAGATEASRQKGARPFRAGLPSAISAVAV